MGQEGQERGGEAGPRVCEGLEGRGAEGLFACTGPGSKRLGIDGDREAVPLTLQIIYSKVSVLLACPSGLLPMPPPQSQPPMYWAQSISWKASAGCQGSPGC